MGPAVFQSIVAMSLFALIIVWVPRMWYWASMRRAATRASTFLLLPSGTRPDDLDRASAAISGTLDSLGSRMGAGVSVHRFRDGTVTRTAVTVYGHRDPDDIARSFASAVGATVERCDDDFVVPTPGNVWYTRRMDYINRDPNDRELPELGEAVEWLGQEMAASSDDVGVCLSIGIEPMSRYDARILRRWYNIRSSKMNDTEGIGHGRASRVMITCWSEDETVAQQVTSGLPSHLHRWPFTVSSRLVTSLRTWGATTATVFGSALTMFVLGTVVNVFRSMSSFFDAENEGGGVADEGLAGSIAETGFVAYWTTSWGLLTLALCTFLAVCTILSWKMRAWPNRSQATYRKMHRFGVVPVERTPLWSPVRMSKAVIGKALPVDLQEKYEGQQRSVNFPYRVRTLVFNSHHVAEMLAFPPMHDTAQQFTSVSSVDAPTEYTQQVQGLRHDDASLLGDDPKGRQVQLLDSDRKHGVFIVGDPGSGKSVAALRLFQQDAIARKNTPLRRDGKMTMLWFETKGDGADQAQRLLMDSGYGPKDFVRFDLTATDGYRLELLDRTSPQLTAARLVAAFTYAFETGSVGPRAAEAMRAAFTLSLMITPDIAEAAGMRKRWPNVLQLGIMLMGSTTSTGVRAQLLEVFRQAAEREYLHIHGKRPTQLLDDLSAAQVFDEETADEDNRTFSSEDGTSDTGSPLLDAWMDWSYYEKMASHRRAEILDSPRNKLTAIAQSRALWEPSPTRPDVTFRQLLEYHGVGILNFGSSLHGTVDEMTSSRLAAMTLYLLWEEIKGTCPGWLSQDRSVGIYADELSHLSGTGSGSDIIEQMRDKGRSSGVQLTLATQRFTQLPQRTQESTRGFGTRMYMTTENIEHAQTAAFDLNGGPEGILSARDVRELPTGRSAMRMRFRDAGMPPFTVNVTYPFTQNE